MPGQPLAIPRVELLEELGRGAHSVVYRARRDGRYFAVKQPIHGETGAKAQLLSERFRREAVALARVRHPALPAVMEVGEVERVPYIIMELAAGETLSERLRKGPLPESHLIELARQLADGLAAIHRSGLVHRDVKPKNILFDSQTTAVRLVDFGFAASADARLWNQGPAGTRGYMAPEQASALRERVDGRADLFSLGCVLFEAATCTPAFADVDALRLLQQHAGRVSQPSNRSERPDESLEAALRISKEFAEIIAGLLERDPDERYQTAEALLEDLEQLEYRGARRTSRRGTLKSALRSAGPQLPLVGRDRELSRLRAAWLDSQAGRGRVVVVKGRAGTGKTRLVERFLEDVARAGRVALAATSQASDPKPFSAIRQLIEGYVDALEQLPGGDKVRAIARLRDLAGDVAPLLRVLSSRLSRIFQDSPPVPRFDDAAHVFAEGLTEFLLKLVRDLEPAVVFIDNAHWLDTGSRRVLTRMAERSLASSVLTIFGVRTSGSTAEEERPIEELLPDASIELTLGPLGEAHIMPLVQAYLGRPRVDTDVLRTVASLTDGSALASLEVLRAMLDAGVLVPWWGTWKLDREALVNIQLPRETVEILARRISALDEMTRSALRAAAVVGMEFDDDLLADAAGLEYGHVNAALAEARRALLIEAAPRARHRFVHDSIREVLLSMLSEDHRRQAHQRIAERLDERGPPASVEDAKLPWRSEHAGDASQAADQLLPTFPPDGGPDADFRYALASHYASGQPDKSPARVLDTNVDAARLAFRAFDNERALAFYAAAGAAAALLSSKLDPGVELLAAEALLRTGTLEQSLERFQRLVESSSDRELNARALSRIAWIQMQLDSDAAERALDNAFIELDVRPPSNSFFMIVLAVLSMAWRAMLPRRRVRDVRERRRLETLVILYYLRGRLAFQMSRPIPFVQATLLCQDPAERLGPSDALTRSCLMMSFLCMALGWARASNSRLARAGRIGRETRDPVVQGHVLQVHAVIAAWSGDVRDSLEAGARSLEDFGHWRELAEFCVTAYSLAQIEGLRGRNRDAWRLIELAVQKINQHDGAPLALDYMETAARAALAGLGRENEADSLLGRLRNAVLRTPRKRVFVVAPYGSQVRLFTESGRLGADFETFVAEIRKAGHNPRRVHMEMTEYYVHVAHARVYACLRASAVERKKLLEALRESLRDLKLAARIPLLRAHARVVEGYEAFFMGNRRKAERLFNAAQALGEQEGAPWVLYAVHRGRAHLFSEQGRASDARDQAKLAEALAREHGAAHRLQWIREEFSLGHAHWRAERGGTSSEYSASSSSSPSSRGLARRRGYLRALLRITEARDEELTPERQAAAVLDEIVQSLGAERGLLLLASDAGRAERPNEVAARLRVIAARSADASDLDDPGIYDRELVEEALTLEQEQLVEVTDSPTERRISLSSDARRSMIVAPVVMHEAALGAIYLERPSARGAFSEQDGELLSLFALQVPVALELARALYIRERAEEALRNADKLEAVGKLAGGVAHDFNNMLTVILASTDAMMSSRRADVWDDVTTIRSAAERARDLTRQLMAFARGQYSNPERLLLNDSIRRLEPVFRRLLGPTIELELRLDAELHGITADPAQVDQVLMNLAMNAGDAMPRGGRLIIETANVVLDDDYVQSSPRVSPGRYARVVVSDTGEGMDDATRARIFEPFFTTKADRSGTGLGLATVYGIVTQAGGHIEVTSRVGVGTVFRIYVPRSQQSVSSRSPIAVVSPPGGAETVMVVDDEPLVRDSMRRMLHRLGYHVLLASGGEEALRIADVHRQELSLVITDVLMPGMNGLELARELAKRSEKLSMLFVSGYTDGVLAERGILRERVEFLQKPVSYETLARRVREVLDGS